MKQVVLARYAKGNPQPADFALVEAPRPRAGAAQVHPGEVLYGPTVSQVVASRHPDYAVGDIVEGRTGWLREGKISFPETVVEGLAAAPEAFARVFADNSFVGKLLVKVPESRA